MTYSIHDDDRPNEFQSTHPRRVWRYTVLFVADLAQVSIHTPTKGVTSVEEGINTLKCVSIHTPTKGVTFFGYFVFATLEVSIHTPTKGVTKYFP